MDSATFKTLIYNMAGANVHAITVDETVWNNDIIPKCIQIYVEKHYNGSYPSVYKLDLVDGETNYTLPDAICSVTAVLRTSMGSGVSPEVAPRKIMMENYAYNSGSGGLISYSYFSALMGQQQITYGRYYDFYFSALNNKFVIMNPEAKTELFLEVFIDESVESLEEMYNDFIFRDMVLSQLLIAWARTMNKYDLQLVGGRQLNWSDIKEDGETLWETTMEKIDNEYSEQVGIMIG